MGIPNNISDQPAEYRSMVDGAISAVATRSVVVSSALSAGSRHILSASPSLAEVQLEQIHWQLDPGLQVRLVVVTLEVEPRYISALAGTAGLASVTHEARSLRVTANPGDDTQAALRLQAGLPDVHDGMPGWRIEIPSNVSITDIYAVVALSDVASPLVGGARVRMVGYSYVS